MPETALGGDNVRFQPTMWTTILRARDAGGDEARLALGRLAERYWKPLYFFVRRQGSDVETAKDLTQAFFERVLEKDCLRDVAPEKGRFRNWLLAALRHFLADARDRAGAAKRGGGRVVPLDVDSAERHLAGSAEPAERLFARAWAADTIERTLAKLRAEWADGDYDALARHLSGASGTYRETAEALGVAEHDVKNRLTKLRKRMREILRAEVAESLEDGADVDAEIAELFAALGK